MLPEHPELLHSNRGLYTPVMQHTDFPTVFWPLHASLSQDPLDELGQNFCPR